LISRYQYVSILDFIGAKDDKGGGDNWSYKTCSSKLSPPTNEHPVSLEKAKKKKNYQNMISNSDHGLSLQHHTGFT